MYLDAPFEALPPGKAAVAEAEQRRMLEDIAELAVSEGADLILMPGNLYCCGFGEAVMPELFSVFGKLPIHVFIAPGCFDSYEETSPYAGEGIPANIHIFRDPQLKSVDCPEKNCRVFGAAWAGEASPCIDSKNEETDSETVAVMCVCGRNRSGRSVFSGADIAESGCAYAALGGLDKATDICRAEKTQYSYSGSPAGKRFSCSGEKTVSIIDIDEPGCHVTRVPVANRRYGELTVDITSQNPLLAVQMAVQDDTLSDIYRIVLTGTPERRPDLEALSDELSDFFFHVSLTDATTPPAELWQESGDDSMKEIFLRMLRTEAAKNDAGSKRKAEQAMLWGLAAMENSGEETV